MLVVQEGRSHETAVRPVVEKLIRQYEQGLLCACELASEIALVDAEVA